MSYGKKLFNWPTSFSCQHISLFLNIDIYLYFVLCGSISIYIFFWRLKHGKPRHLLNVQVSG